MVQRRVLNKRQKRVIELLNEGYSIPTVASTIGMSLSGTYAMVANLCRRGFLIKNSATISPAMFYKPEEKEISTTPQTEKKSESLPPDYTNPTIPPTICRDGIYYKNPPDDAVRWHMADGIHYKVRAVGTFENILFCGREIGKWDDVRDFNKTPDKTSRRRRITYHKGHINAFGQRMNLLYYCGKKCGHQFTLFPGSIFAVPDKYNFTDMSCIFSDRALWVANILRNTGWQITDPKFLDKNIHWATRDESLTSQYTTSGAPVPNSELIVDTSDGIDEVEAEHWGNDPLRDEKVKIMAKIPERILGSEKEIENVKTELSETRKEITEIRNEIKELTELAKETAAAIKETAIANEKVLDVLNIQLRESILQVKVNSNILESITKGTQTTFDSYFAKKKQPAEEKPRSEDYLGVYQ